jgi:hypothetical protein
LLFPTCQQSLFRERTGVEKAVDPFAHRQLALRSGFFAMTRWTAFKRALGRFAKRGVAVGLA